MRGRVGAREAIVHAPATGLTIKTHSVWSELGGLLSTSGETGRAPVEGRRPHLWHAQHFDSFLTVDVHTENVGSMLSFEADHVHGRSSQRFQSFEVGNIHNVSFLFCLVRTLSPIRRTAFRVS